MSHATAWVSQRKLSHRRRLARVDAPPVILDPTFRPFPPALAAIPPSAYLHQAWSERFNTAAGTPDAWLAPDVVMASALFRAACWSNPCETLELGPEPLLGPALLRRACW